MHSPDGFVIHSEATHVRAVLVEVRLPRGLRPRPARDMRVHRLWLEDRCWGCCGAASLGLAPASFGSLVGSRPKCEEGEMMEGTIGEYVPSYRPRMALTLKAVRH